MFILSESIAFTAPDPSPAITRHKPAPNIPKEGTLTETENSGIGNGSCVAYAQARTGINLHVGRAKNWWSEAESQGYKRGTIPVKGAVVITTESSLKSPGSGHVAVVEEVLDDTIRISEQNYVKFAVVSERTISIDDDRIVGYIYQN